MMQRNPHQQQPWWNDSDKVSGLLTTIVCLTVITIICLGAVALAAKVLF